VSSGRVVFCLSGLLLVSVLIPRTGRSGELSGTINASYQRDVRQEIRNSSDSVISPGSSSESKQSNIRINYEDILFSKNLMRLGANYFIQRDEIGARWDVRPIYKFDLSSAGYSYSSSYSPRKQTSRLRMPDSTYIETRTYFRDWRNSLSVNYKSLPPLTLSYNLSRNFDDQPVRETDRRRRYISAQTTYSLGPAAANLVYTNTKSENRRPSSQTVDELRTWQGSTGFSGTLNAVGSFSASYSYLDTRATREISNPVPASTTNVHSVALMATSREWMKLSATASYSGRFLDVRSTGTRREVGDEDFSGQLSYSPLSYVALSATKNYHITSLSRGHQIGEYLLFSASFSRFMRRGVDSRVNWTRTYIQKAAEAADSSGATGGVPAAGAANYTDALYFSTATSPYHRSKLLADLSVSRANRPWVESQRYLSARSLSFSISATRHIDCRLSVNYANQGTSLDLFNSFSRSVSAGMTYLHGANLNGNLTLSRYSINTAPRQSSSAMSGYLGYSFRNTYSLYVYMNRSRQQTPGAGTAAAGNAVRTPRSWSSQLQAKLSPKTTLILGYSWSAASVSGIQVSKGNTFQININGQF
jgi:hypothetical protein